MVRWRQAEFSPEHLAAAEKVFRPDLYDAILGPGPVLPAGEPADHVGAFAGRAFDPANIGKA
jgi:NitT/TauT family transport system ATP-binding protein